MHSLFLTNILRKRIEGLEKFECHYLLASWRTLLHFTDGTRPNVIIVNYVTRYIDLNPAKPFSKHLVTIKALMIFCLDIIRNWFQGIINSWMIISMFSWNILLRIQWPNRNGIIVFLFRRLTLRLLLHHQSH